MIPWLCYTYDFHKGSPTPSCCILPAISWSVGGNWCEKWRRCQQHLNAMTLLPVCLEVTSVWYQQCWWLSIYLNKTLWFYHKAHQKWCHHTASDVAISQAWASPLQVSPPNLHQLSGGPDNPKFHACKNFAIFFNEQTNALCMKKKIPFSMGNTFLFGTWTFETHAIDYINKSATECTQVYLATSASNTSSLLHRQES